MPISTQPHPHPHLYLVPILILISIFILPLPHSHETMHRNVMLQRKQQTNQPGAKSTPFPSKYREKIQTRFKGEWWRSMFIVLRGGRLQKGIIWERWHGSRKQSEKRKCHFIMTLCCFLWSVLSHVLMKWVNKNRRYGMLIWLRCEDPKERALWFKCGSNFHLQTNLTFIVGD